MKWILNNAKQQSIKYISDWKQYIIQYLNMSIYNDKQNPRNA
jgi:hypothetical protein